MMKKNNLLILAVAALGFAACANDETTAVNEKLAESNAISFRANVNGQMRAANAAGVKTTPWEATDKIYVNAIRIVSSTPNMYFQSEFDYTTDAPEGFHSTNKYYWPADIATNNIYFTAFWGVPYKTVSSASQYSAYVAKDEFKLNSDYSVADDVSSQMDILYAQSAAISSKPTGSVVLNFRHMLSQIVVNVANDQDNLAITISGVKVGNAKKTGTFQYISGTSDPEPATTGDGKINKGSWASLTGSQTYTQGSAAASMSGTVTSQALSPFTPMILMPQQLNAADEYNDVVADPIHPTAITSSTEPNVNGNYIALKMTVTDKNSGVTIVAEQWCVWPIDTEWQPGYKYTYTVNAGSGGYHPIDRDGNPDLDPVFDNAFIWFSPNCTIDAWTDFDGNNTEAGTQPINVP